MRITNHESERSSLSAVLWVFSAGERRFNATEIVDAAWFRGDLQPFWLEFLLGIAGERQAEADGLEPDHEALQALSEDVRYQHDLITTEETETWLASRNLALDDLTEYSHRRYWREHAAVHAQPMDIDYLDATPEQRELFLGELLFGGGFDDLARRLSWRVAAPVAPVSSDSARSGRLEAERSRFFQRTVSNPGKLSRWLEQLRRDMPWFETLIEQEADHGWRCDQIRTPENRARTLAALRLPLTRFDVEMMDLESADAVREACLCLNADGLSMAELAAQEHNQIERREVLLDEFPEELQQRFLSAENGQVLALISSDDRFQVCRILDKREPMLADKKVLARVDSDLLAAHFGDLVSRHIVWLLARGSSA